jgi:hypothetical protein
VSRLVSRPRVWRRIARKSASSLLIGVAVSSVVLLAPANARPVRNHNPPPTIEYAIDGIRGLNGWYRGSRRGDYVVLRWTVRDPGADVIFTSGCDTEIIKGPTSGSTRTCIAASENGMNSVTTRLIKIDGDPPRFGAVVVQGTSHYVSLRWKASGDAHFAVTRSPGIGGVSESLVYRGGRERFTDRSVRSGVEYRYTLTAIDRAGNSAAKTIRATARPTLLTPRPAVRLRSPRSILFAWDAVPEASYYNIQLWFDDKKVFSAWPSRARLRLVVPWTYKGIRRYLRIGRYTWYVWPARGPRSFGAYGPILGSSTFFVSS